LDHFFKLLYALWSHDYQHLVLTISALYSPHPNHITLIFSITPDNKRRFNIFNKGNIYPKQHTPTLTLLTTPPKKWQKNINAVKNIGSDEKKEEPKNSSAGRKKCKCSDANRVTYAIIENCHCLNRRTQGRAEGGVKRGQGRTISISLHCVWGPWHEQINASYLSVIYEGPCRTQLPTAKGPRQSERDTSRGQSEIAIPKENKKIITATIFLARDYACYIAEPPLQSESPREIPSNILSPFIDKSC